MEQLWTNLLTFINQLVSPDWGALVGLVPLSLLLLVVAYVVWLVVRFASAGPTRRGKHRLPPKPPAGVHAGETSWSPVFAAIGCALLLFGIVFRGPILVAGIVVLVFALVYWLRESMREYDHVEHPTTALVPVVSTGPPPGVHVPGPSFRPIVVSLSLAVLFYGLVFGPWILLAGALMLAISLLQWLIDARREYRGVVLADVSGHLPADPRPGYPRGTLSAFALLFVGAIVLQTGILPPKSTVGGTANPSGPATSGGPGASGAPGASGGPGGSGGPVADVTVTAANIEFEGGATALHEAPAGKPFTIAFHNNDAGIPHNIDIRDGGASGSEVWKGEIFPGVDARLYAVFALNAGTYTFICDIHPTMTGTLTVK